MPDNTVTSAAPVPPENTIWFYSHHPDRPYWWCSNFSNHPVYVFGKVFRNSEAPFQRAKFLGTDAEWMEAIRIAPEPQEAADKGRDKSHPLRADWDKPVALPMREPLKCLWDTYVGEPMLTKDWLMLQVVRAKFRQHAELAQLLLDTGDAMLIEHTPKDRYWADAGDGSGKNMLGKILMIVRAELRAKREARRIRGRR